MRSKSKSYPRSSLLKRYFLIVGLVLEVFYLFQQSNANELTNTEDETIDAKGKEKKREKTASEMFLENDNIMTRKEFKNILFDSMIVPDCIDTVPEHLVKVTFYHGYKVQLGNLIPPKNITDHSPHLVSWPGTIKEYFTLTMVDLDEPQRLYPDERAWLHWLIVNIPGTTRYLGDLKARYIPPKPMEQTGKHRYVFVVYKQPKKINFEGFKLINETKHNDLRRSHFSCRDFSKQYDLGNPWAINYFQSEFQI